MGQWLNGRSSCAARFGSIRRARGRASSGKCPRGACTVRPLLHPSLTIRSVRAPWCDDRWLPATQHQASTSAHAETLRHAALHRPRPRGATGHGGDIGWATFWIDTADRMYVCMWRVVLMWDSVSSVAAISKLLSVSASASALCMIGPSIVAEYHALVAPCGRRGTDFNAVTNET